ncbi:hypothetical protein ACLM5J_02845 [Nocardioides sp. Bht2]|uniref:hypothetical protein n=1 Tax=Nocardioides sp. Bht2 TaxID=3392297 RepID=UPI0039B5EBD4
MANDPKAKSKPTAEPSVVLLDAMEAYPSRTFEDWRAHADAVVLAEVVSERRVEPLEDATAPKRFPVSRKIAIKVSDVYWERPGANPPAEFEMEAFGWMTLENDEEVPMVAPDASRLEVGHRYLLAVHDIERATRAGDVVRWTVLGSGGALPADAQIGVGELEARKVAAPEQRSAESEVVADALAGLSLREAEEVIRQSLRSTR